MASTPPPPTGAPAAAAAAPAVLMQGELHKLGGSSRKYLPTAASKKLLSWKPKQCQILSDGTFLYTDAQSAPSSPSSPAPTQPTDDSDGASFAAPLLPHGAALLTRLAQVSLVDDLPAGLCAGGAFTLRTRGPGGPKKLRLAAPRREDAAAWCAAANAAARAGVLDGHCPLLAVWEGEVEKDGCVAEGDVAALLRAANIKVRDAELRGMLADAGAKGRVQYAQLMTVLGRLHVTEAGRDLWLRAGGVAGGPGLSAAQVAGLVGADVGVVQRWLSERDVAGEGGDGVDVALLQEFVCDAVNDACDAAALELGDMTQSLSEYFMNSSHNTYLTGDQLTSDSSPAMYRLVLEAGGRCVEIDMWDGDDGEPCVTHGHTATSKIALRDVLVAVKQHAFAASPYPVVLSLENHLCEAQQVIAADLIRKVLGDALEVLRLAEGEALPSPESLKHKILVKAKKGNWGKVGGTPDEEEEEDDDDDDDDDDEEDSGESDKGGGAPEAGAASAADRKDSVLKSRFSGLMKMFTTSGSSATSPKAGDGRKGGEEKKPTEITEELAEVTSFGGANRKKLCELWETGAVHPAGQEASDIVSINESKVAELFGSGKVDVLQRYNSRNLTRVYPKGTRVDSSNYNPMVAWASGCQITALNFQTADLGMWLNHGRFIVNGGSGYVRKSAPAGTSGASISGAGSLDVHVLFGSLLPRAASSVRLYDVADPYVEVTLARCGQTGDADSRGRRTKAVPANGLSPCWRERMLSMRVSDADLDMLLVCVWDEDTTSKDDLIGFYCAPVHALRPGIRSLNLCTRDGAPLTVPGTHQLPSIVCEIAWKPATVGSYASLQSQ
jgi:phosphatidylinositol phospholipase C, delta